MQQAFISYVRSIHLQKDKSVFKLDALPLDEYAASLGLAGAPKIKFGTKQEASEKKNQARVVEELRKEIEVKGAEEESDEDDEDESGEEEDDEPVAGPSGVRSDDDAEDKVRRSSLSLSSSSTFFTSSG